MAPDGLWGGLVNLDLPTWSSLVKTHDFRLASPELFMKVSSSVLFCTLRGKSGVCKNLLVVTLNVQWTSFSAISEFHMMTTEHGFSPKSGFKLIWWPQNMVLVLNLDSQTIAYTKHSSTFLLLVHCHFKIQSVHKT